jgi:hypothetical protein
MAARDEGIEALKGGNAALAAQLLGRAVTENPQDAQAHAYLGAAFGQLNQLQQAVESLQKAAALAPQSAPMRFNLGMALEKAGRRDDAVAAYQQALGLDGAYERARQALTRLGVAPSAAAAPVSTPAAPPNPVASPAPAAAGLAEFALGGDAAVAPAPPPPVPQSYGAPPPPPPPAAGPYGPVPNVYGSPPPAYGAPPPPPPPPAYPAGPAGPPPGLQPMGDWTPPPGAAPPPGPPVGLQPMGEWTPAPGEAPPPWGPPPQPTVQPLAVGATGAVVATAHNPERELPKSMQRGHCYLAGMGIGVWWGLIGMLFVLIMPGLTLTGSQYGRIFPTLFVIGLMYVALGAILYGLNGVIGCASSDAEGMCGNVGASIGLLQGLVWYFMVPTPWMGWIQLFGCIWVSRQLGRALGGRINEWFSTVFVVAGPGGVAMTPLGR